jgi:hypothetical protein
MASAAKPTPRHGRILGTALIIAGVIALVFALVVGHVIPSWSTIWVWLRHWWLGISSCLLIVGGMILLARALTSQAAASTTDTSREHDDSGDRLSRIATSITAFTALAALVFTGLPLRSAREQNSIAEQGQITDRYTHAIDQLAKSGPDGLVSRLGGIYALQRMSVDSPRDRDAIRRVLTAFIRTNTVRYPDPVPCDGVKEDITGALTAITEGGRDELYGNLEKLCLRGVMVATANGAEEADLGNLDFSDSDLQDAELSYVHGTMTFVFDGAYMVSAHLVDDDLRKASLDPS